MPAPANCPRAAVASYRFAPGDPRAARLAARSFVYDNALALLAHLARDRGRAAEHREAARALGATLATWVELDPRVGFSFSLEEPAFYSAGYVRTGAMAWVGYALAFYDAATGETRFRDAAARVADALLATRVPDDAAGENSADPRRGLLPAGRGLWVQGGARLRANQAVFCVTEHQIDAYFLLARLGQLAPAGPYAAAARALGERIVASLWLENEGRFAAAVTADGPVREAALDASGAWGALFLLARGDAARAARALAFTRARFATRVEGHEGFAPYSGAVAEYPGRDFSETFASEGTAAMALALLRAGDRDGAARYAAALREVQASRDSGGLRYAFPDAPDFPDVPAVAPTAWFVLLELELRRGPGATGVWTESAAAAATSTTAAPATTTEAP